MKLPGTRFLSERRTLKAFETQEASWRDLVMYSESSADWPHLGPVLTNLLDARERTVSYVTSDAKDPGLTISHPQLRTFLIGTGMARTVLFARMNCRHFVMTLPDLGNLWLKRSVHPVHYVYLFHSINSTHTSYRKGAFDQFDTVLCVGPHHTAEIRRTEEIYGLSAKELIEHGSVKLDTLLAEVASTPSTASAERPVALVAPTWGNSSLIERPIGRAVISTLLAAGIETILRPHPMTVRRLPDLVTGLEREFASNPLFKLEVEMAATSSWLRSDVMISDWSGAASEYAFALLKPVVYIDTPPKTMNPQWVEVGLQSFEDRVRSEVGTVVEEAGIAQIPSLVQAFVADRSTVAERAREARERLIFNVGSSARVAAAYLSSLP